MKRKIRLNNNKKLTLNKNNAVNRIDKEIATAMKSKLFKYSFDESNKLIGFIEFTINNGLYKDQKHTLEVKFEYGSGDDIYRFPQDPPLVKFLSKIWHPNIGDHSGTICMDTIKHNWTPQAGLEMVFNSILVLLEEPNNSSPQNPRAATTYKNMDEHIEKIKSFYEPYNLS